MMGLFGCFLLAALLAVTLIYFLLFPAAVLGGLCLLAGLSLFFFIWLPKNRRFVSGKKRPWLLPLCLALGIFGGVLLGLSLLLIRWTHSSGIYSQIIQPFLKYLPSIFVGILQTPALFHQYFFR